MSKAINPIKASATTAIAIPGKMLCVLPLINAGRIAKVRASERGITNFKRLLSSSPDMLPTRSRIAALQPLHLGEDMAEMF
ncbi:hypothetical protein, partial [Planktotalea sp.]|uniref:hypothetical protein n=1 Tax=Planktotalea sp. TaxID=2029877 RepID=UPI003296C673